MTQDQILKNCEMIQKAIDLSIPLGDIDSTEGKLIELVALMGLSAETMKEAKFQVLQKQGLIIKKIRLQEPGINATTQKLLLESELAMEITLYDYAERLNAAIVHACDSLRTSISKYKSERELAAYGK